ncbi:MAG: NUDIX hydrolase [Parasporobacterium sp.]|nr:NUDIX hydrolase [Parasporobacterium sp.]
MDEMQLENLKEWQLSSAEKYRGKLLHVFSDEVRLPDGKTAVREYIRHIGAVCMVALTDEGNVILEKQYRYPIGRVITEIPAGKLDRADEDRLEAAKRELKEETGITADHWTEIGEFISIPAYTQERVTMFLARGLHRGERHLDEEEFLEVFEMPLQEAVDLVLSGRISDGKTIAAILKVYLLLQRETD